MERLRQSVLCLRFCQTFKPFEIWRPLIANHIAGQFRAAERKTESSRTARSRTKLGSQLFFWSNLFRGLLLADTRFAAAACQNQNKLLQQ